VTPALFPSLRRWPALRSLACLATPRNARPGRLLRNTFRSVAMTLTTRQRVLAGTRDARVVRRGTKRTHHAQLTFRFVVPTVFTFLTFLCFHARVTVAELGTSAHDLSNFQGKHACAAGLRMAIPQTVGDVAAVVAAFPKVRAVGVGHSWNKQMFCACSLSQIRRRGVYGPSFLCAT